MPLEGTLDVSVGETLVEFRLVLRNVGEGPVSLEFRSGQSADFVVYEDKTEVYRWSAGRMFTQAIRTETIDPGDSVTYAGDWPDPDTGTYKVVATLEATGVDVEATEEFYVY